ncbi:MAG TPA: GspMb/PilO family protein [Stellaceae bacterium]|nr:GspMb/PilO family protein [Stellaceae bacterium]
MTVHDAEERPKRLVPNMAAGLASELAGNRRAQIGLVAILALLAAYGLLALGDASDGLRPAYVQAMQRLHRVAAADREANWSERATASGEMRQALEKSLWPAESEGGALADLQDWVTRTGREVGLDKLQVRVEVATPKGLPANVRQLTATITAPQTEENIVNLLARIAREPHLLVVDRLRIQERPVPNFEMVLVAYARLTPPAARGKATAR